MRLETGVVATWHGPCSTFGGPNDTGMQPDEGVALYNKQGARSALGLWLPTRKPRVQAYGRDLNPTAFYIACRWKYGAIRGGVVALRSMWCRVTVAAPRSAERPYKAYCRPVDWGPNERTGRVADLSPGLAEYLNVQTDDVVTVDLLEL